MVARAQIPKKGGHHHQPFESRMGQSPGKFRKRVFLEKHDHLTELTLHFVSLLLLQHKQVSCANDVPLHCTAKSEKYISLRVMPTVHLWDFYLLTD